MGVYAQFDGDAGGAVEAASTTGWGDVCRWIDTVPVAGAENLHHLRHHGWDDAPGALADQFAAALKGHPPEPTVATTVRQLVGAMRDHRAAKYVEITDGMGADDGPDEWDEEAADYDP